MTLTKNTERDKRSMCDIQSFPSLLSVELPNINNLSGVVKDTVWFGTRPTTHISGAHGEDLVTEFISCLFH